MAPLRDFMAIEQGLLPRGRAVVSQQDSFVHGTPPSCWAGGYSSVNPIFRETCQCATLPSTTWPRVSVMLNHWMFRTVSCALAMAALTASSILTLEEPVSSSSL